MDLAVVVLLRLAQQESKQLVHQPPHRNQSKPHLQMYNKILNLLHLSYSIFSSNSRRLLRPPQHQAFPCVHKKHTCHRQDMRRYSLIVRINLFLTGSNGILPKNSMLNSLHKSSVFPFVNTSVTSPQHGHTKPLMFSRIPNIGIFIFVQNVICNVKMIQNDINTSFLIVERATSCGVVTMTTPSGFASFNALTTVICSSEVPFFIR